MFTNTFLLFIHPNVPLKVETFADFPPPRVQPEACPPASGLGKAGTNHQGPRYITMLLPLPAWLHWPQKHLAGQSQL